MTPRPIALQQARLFKEAMDITGIVLTKLDGTAKGGVIIGIQEELGVPVQYILIPRISSKRCLKIDNSPPL